MRTRPFLRLWRNDSGIAAIEAALILPVFIFFIVGAVEIYQFFRAQSIVERGAYEIAQSLSLQKEVFNGAQCDASDNLCVYERVARHLLHPLDFDRHGRLELTVLTTSQKDEDSPVLWNVEPGWPVSFGNKGITGSPAASFPLTAERPEETVLAVELAYDTSHLILTGRMRQALTGSSTIVSRAYLRTRNDALRELKPAQL